MRLLPPTSRFVCLTTSLSFLVFALFFLTLVGWKLSYFELDSVSLIWHSSGHRPQWSVPASSKPPSVSEPPSHGVIQAIPTHTAMSSPPEPLDAFLGRVKAQALAHLRGEAMAGGKDTLVLVMGNEAGDLDSAASAIGLSYLLSTFGTSPGLPSTATTLYAPLIQSSASDLSLRPENKVAYAACHVKPDSLLFVSDLTSSGGLSLDLKTSPALSPSKGTLLGLVDHPSLTPSWGGPTNDQRKVVLLVDHHEDEGAHADAPLRIMRGVGVKDAEGKPVMPAGSASSLVVEAFAPLIAKDKARLPRELADLLISANILDTDNLRRPPKGKASPADVAAFNIFEPLSSFVAEHWADINSLALSSSPSEVAASLEGSGNFVSGSVDGADTLATQSYWGILAASKAAVGDMNGRDLLRRDYKEVVEKGDGDQPSFRFGFSSVPIGLATWLHRERTKSSPLTQTQSNDDWSHWWGTLVAWMEERRLDGAVVGTSFREEGKHKRELVLAFSPLQTPKSRQIWTSMLDSLTADAHTSHSEPANRLLLELPWKGLRLDGEKRERVAGLEAVGIEGAPTGLDIGGRLVAASGSGRNEILAQVWRQANDKASRKVVLPAVMHALQRAVRV